MINLQKIKKRINNIQQALGNVEYGRMPISHLEAVFERDIEYIRDLLDAERFNTDEKPKTADI